MGTTNQTDRTTSSGDHQPNRTDYLKLQFVHLSKGTRIECFHYWKTYKVCWRLKSCTANVGSLWQMCMPGSFINNVWSLVMTGLTDVYGLKWYIHQCVHPCITPVSFWYIHQCVHPCITPVSFGPFTNAFTRASPLSFPQVSEPIQTNHLLTTCLTQSERASLHTCWYQCISIWKIIETASEPNNVAADLHRELLDSPTSSGSSRLVAEGD